MVTAITDSLSNKLAGRQALIIMICIVSLSGVENYSLLVIAQPGTVFHVCSVFPVMYVHLVSCSSWIPDVANCDVMFDGDFDQEEGGEREICSEVKGL
jgi:hypothetical protein